MSEPTTPYARGPGILLGIIILWAGSLGALWLGKVVLVAMGVLDSPEEA